MELTDTLKGQLRRTREAGASQQEREAVIDLLVMTMYADRFIDEAENDAIDRVAENIEGDAARPLVQYLNASIAKVRETLGHREQHDALLRDISERLNTDRMRKLAYDASRAVARADDEMADEEEQFLRTVKGVFGMQA